MTRRLLILTLWLTLAGFLLGAFAGLAGAAALPTEDDAIRAGIAIGARIHPGPCGPSNATYDRDPARLHGFAGYAHLAEGVPCAFTIRPHQDAGDTLAWLCSAAAHELSHWNWTGGDLDGGLHSSDPNDLMARTAPVIPECLARFGEGCVSRSEARRTVRARVGRRYRVAWWGSRSSADVRDRDCDSEQVVRVVPRGRSLFSRAGRRYSVARPVASYPLVVQAVAR